MRAERPGERGFTLLEVLVAVAIVGLGMIAVFAQLNQSLLSAAFLRERTLAHWIAVDRLTELRLAGEFPPVGERSDDIEFGPYRWRYTLRIAETPGANLRRVDVTVALRDSPDRTAATLVGFLGQPVAGAPIFTDRWFPLDEEQPVFGGAIDNIGEPDQDGNDGATR
jgi:general secretion pathway protein I